MSGLSVLHQKLEEMDRWVGKVALVTGASAGIGAEIAKMLAAKGMKVIAVARRLEKLEELAVCVKREFKADIHPMICDVRKEEDILKIFKWADDKLGGIDVLVNNAAVISYKPIIEESTETYCEIMDVNVIATAICSREFVRSVKKRKTCGHIININSITGHYAESFYLPLSVYCASKYAITGMTHSLHNEISNENLNIRITSISPGVVKTDMTANMPSYLVEKLGELESRDIADGVIYVLSAPPNVVISELTIRAYGQLISVATRP